MGRDGADALEGSFSPYKIRDHRCYLEEQGLTDPTPPTPEEHLYNQLYELYPQHVGKRTSRKERRQHGFVAASLTYGEICFGPFAGLFQVLRNDGLQPGGKFCDLGSGAGRAVFAAALSWDFEKVLGIEILQGLHELCDQKLLPRFDLHIREKMESETRREVDVNFIRGDATVIDEWISSRVVFANSTCFDRKLMETLAKMASNMDPGCYFITMTAPLPSDDFELRWTGTMREAWGDGTVFIQRRVDEDALEAERLARELRAE